MMIVTSGAACGCCCSACAGTTGRQSSVQIRTANRWFAERMAFYSLIGSVVIRITARDSKRAALFPFTHYWPSSRKHVADFVTVGNINSGGWAKGVGEALLMEARANVRGYLPPILPTLKK